MKKDTILPRTYVVARCVACKAEKKVGPNEGQPFCDKCGSMMFAVRAHSEREAVSTHERTV